MSEPHLEATFPASRAAVGYWTGTITGAGRVLPDGHVDIVSIPGRPPFLAGADTRPVAVSAPSGAPVIGIRLRAGVAAAIVGADARALVDARIALDTFLDRIAIDRLTTALGASADDDAIVNALVDSVENAIPHAWKPDPLVTSAVADVRAGKAIDRDGLSPRQYRRRFTAAIGYGPKLYERICRLNRFIELVGRAPANRALARLAVEAGYYDEAHLGRDAAMLAGTTPADLRPR